MISLKNSILLLVLTASSYSYGAQIGQVVTVRGECFVSAPGVAKTKLVENASIPEKAEITTGKAGSVKILFSDDSIMDLAPNSSFKVEDYQLKSGNDRTGVFSLAYGKIRSLVSKPVGASGNYKVKTRDAVMGIRGTEFVVSAAYAPPGANPTSLPPTNIAVTSGTVAVANSMAAQSGSNDFGGGAGPGAGATTNAPPAMTASVSAGQSFSTSAFASAASSSSSSGSTSGGTAAPAATTMSASQMSSVMEGAKVQDNTFVANVAVDQSSSARTQSSQGERGGQGEGAAGGPGGPGGPGGGQHQGGGAVAMAMGQLVNLTSAPVGSLIGSIQIHDMAPTGISIKDVITAPPVNMLPGTSRIITITIQ